MIFWQDVTTKNRYPTSMMRGWRVNVERFTERRKELKLSQRKLAELTGVTQQAIGKIEKGETVQPKHMHAYASAMRVPVEVLIDSPPELVEDDTLIIFNIPLISWSEVGELANREVGALPAEPLDWIPVAYTHSNLVALKVNGGSMNRVAREGATIIVDMTERELVDEGLYVVQHEGRPTFKRYRDNPPSLHPDSLDPDYTPVPLGKADTVLGRVRKIQFDV